MVVVNNNNTNITELTTKRLLQLGVIFLSVSQLTTVLSILHYPVGLRSDFSGQRGPLLALTVRIALTERSIEGIFIKALTRD